MTRIKDKYDFLAFIKRKKKPRKTWEQQKSISEYSTIFDYKADINQDIKI